MNAHAARLRTRFVDGFSADGAPPLRSNLAARVYASCRFQLILYSSTPAAARNRVNTMPYCRYSTKNSQRSNSLDKEEPNPLLSSDNSLVPLAMSAMATGH